MTGKNFLKRCWKASPQSLHYLLLGGLCLLRAQKRVTAADAAPLFVCGAFRNPPACMCNANNGKVRMC